MSCKVCCKRTSIRISSITSLNTSDSRRRWWISRAGFKEKENEVAMTVDVMDFLKDWLVKHIMGADKRYVPHLTARGVR